MQWHPKRQRHHAPARACRRRAGRIVVVLGVIGTAGCGGGGGIRRSSSQPAALLLDTPASVTGTAADGLAFTFSEALTTISGQPGVIYSLHESNNGPAPVTISAGQDPTTQSLFPRMTVRVQDPQGRPLSLPPVTGAQTLTLYPGDTADAALTLNLGYFTQPGLYTASVSADGTEAVPALTNALVLSAR